MYDFRVVFPAAHSRWPPQERACDGDSAGFGCGSRRHNCLLLKFGGVREGSLPRAPGQWKGRAQLLIKDVQQRIFTGLEESLALERPTGSPLPKLFVNPTDSPPDC